jgi:hypothetical protein
VALFRRTKNPPAEPPTASPSAPVTSAEAVELVTNSRDQIVWKVAMEMGKSAQGLKGLEAAGRIENPSKYVGAQTPFEAQLKQAAIDYPIWAITTLIEGVSTLPPGPIREAAISAGRAAAEQFAASNLGHVTQSDSLEVLTDIEKILSIVRGLADAAIAGFTDALGGQPVDVAPPPITTSNQDESVQADDLLGSGSPEQRIAAAEALAESGDFRLRLPHDEIPSDRALAEALAQSGDARVPLRLISAFDTEQDDEVRMGIFKALLGIFIDVREREDLAAVKGLELATEDRATLLVLQDAVARMKEELEAAEGR